MKVGMLIGKVKKFEIGWCIPHRVAADNAEGGIGLRLFSLSLTQLQWWNSTFKVDALYFFLLVGILFISTLHCILLLNQYLFELFFELFGWISWIFVGWSSNFYSFCCHDLIKFSLNGFVGAFKTMDNIRWPYKILLSSFLGPFTLRLRK